MRPLSLILHPYLDMAVQEDVVSSLFQKTWYVSEQVVLTEGKLVLVI